MYRQYDGYLEVHGYDLALFLESYLSKYKEYKDQNNMRRLADELFSYFKETEGEYIEEVHMEDPYYWCHEYEYHIYKDNVKILGLDEDVEINWKTDKFLKFCKNESNESNESNENNENDNFGKVDWEQLERDNDEFGKVNWENFKTLEDWVKPEDGYCSPFKFNGILYFRDSDDYIWISKNKDENIDYIVGRFNKDTEIIDELDGDKFEYE